MGKPRSPEGEEWTFRGEGSIDGQLTLLETYSALVQGADEVTVTIAGGVGAVRIWDEDVALWDGATLTTGTCTP